MKLGDITINQIKEQCEKSETCRDCPFQAHCKWIFDSQVPSTFEEDMLKIEINLSDPIQILIDRDIMTENGEIADAYKDIIVKKENEK